MAKPCSEDLRERVIEVVAKGASRRAAGERFAVSASSAVRWVQRWHQSGECGGDSAQGPLAGSGRACRVAVGADR